MASFMARGLVRAASAGVRSASCTAVRAASGVVPAVRAVVPRHRPAWRACARRLQSTEAGGSKVAPREGTAPATSGGGASAENAAAVPVSAPATADTKTGNFFFDNPALFGALFCASVIGYFYYNKRGTDARTAVIDQIDADAAVSPREIRQLREDNKVSVEKYTEFVRATLQDTPAGSKLTYDALNELLMKHLFKEQEVVHWGHHLERVLKALQTQKDPERKGLDPRILLTAMSLSLQAKAADRVHPLFEVFSPDGAAMTVDDFIACIEALRDTFQLPSEFQVHRTVKYPFPEYERMSAEELALDAISKCESLDADASTIDEKAFRAMLMSKSLCTWGECFASKKKRRRKKKKKKSEDEEVMEVFLQARRVAETAEAQVQGLQFMAADTFQGSRPGYVFQLGEQGMGYYPDARQAMEARDAGLLPPLETPMADTAATDDEQQTE